MIFFNYFGIPFIIMAAIKNSICIIRLPCKFFGNFNVVINDMADTGVVGRRRNSTTVRACTLECISWSECKSFNYYNKTASCELLQRGLNESVLLMKKTIGSVYMTTNDAAINNGYVCEQMSPCQNGARCTDACTGTGYECHCKPLYYGIHCEKLIQDCAAVKESGQTESGIYEIKPDYNFQISVNCDFKYGTKNWIVFQRRVDATVDFYRNWTSYKNGFGDPKGNFWIGLDTLHKLAGPGKGAILRVDLKHYNSPSSQYYAKYNAFEIGDEASAYKLYVRGYSGNAGDSMAFQNNMKWSTFDRDNDPANGENCAAYWKGAWWYNTCHKSHLNGLYPTTKTTSPAYMSWHELFGSHGNIFFSEMKIKYH